MINPPALRVELSASDPQNRQEVLTGVGIRTEETLSGWLGDGMVVWGGGEGGLTPIVKHLKIN